MDEEKWLSKESPFFYWTCCVPNYEWTTCDFVGEIGRNDCVIFCCVSRNRFWRMKMIDNDSFI